MLVVRGNMKILGTRRIAPLCLEIKCELDGKKYQRIIFGLKYSPDYIEWTSNGEYLSEGLKQILEKIYTDQNKEKN